MTKRVPFSNDLTSLFQDPSNKASWIPLVFILFQPYTVEHGYIYTQFLDTMSIFIQLFVQKIVNKLFKTDKLDLLKYDRIKQAIKQQFEVLFDSNRTSNCCFIACLIQQHIF